MQCGYSILHHYKWRICSALLHTVSCLGVYGVLMLTVSSQGIYMALHTVSPLWVCTMVLYTVSCPGIHGVLLHTVSFVWEYVE